MFDPFNFYGHGARDYLDSLPDINWTHYVGETVYYCSDHGYSDSNCGCEFDDGYFANEDTLAQIDILCDTMNIKIKSLADMDILYAALDAHGKFGTVRELKAWEKKIKKYKELEHAITDTGAF